MSAALVCCLFVVVCSFVLVCCSLRVGRCVLMVAVFCLLRAVRFFAVGCLLFVVC